MAREDSHAVDGRVIDIVFHTMLSRELANGHPPLELISGKMRLSINRILPRDKVLLEISPYDLTKGRITFRQK